METTTTNTNTQLPVLIPGQPNAENPDDLLLRSLDQTSELNPVKDIQEINEPSKEMKLQRIKDLTNEYIAYAKVHPCCFFDSNGRKRFLPVVAPPWILQQDDLIEALSQYTGVPPTEKQVSDIQSFFTSMTNRTESPQDPNGDGQQDVNDVLFLLGKTHNYPPPPINDENSQ